MADLLRSSRMFGEWFVARRTRVTMHVVIPEFCEVKYPGPSFYNVLIQAFEKCQSLMLCEVLFDWAPGLSPG